MSDILCVTNRKLCKEDFLVQIDKIAACRPAGIVLREKDLCEPEYKELAKNVKKICDMYETKCILHTFINTAIELNCDTIHLPMHILKTLSEDEKKRFLLIGTSCHSADEAKAAEQMGCSYIFAGHIFDTDCKKGICGRGLDFLHTVCKSVSIPVYAIGGISASNAESVRDAGALGICIMSSIMKCDNPAEYMQSLE